MPRAGNYSICLSGQNFLTIIFVMKTNIQKPRDRQTERQKYWGYFQLEPNNMLVKKSILHD